MTWEKYGPMEAWQPTEAGATLEGQFVGYRRFKRGDTGNRFDVVVVQTVTGRFFCSKSMAVNAFGEANVPEGATVRLTYEGTRQTRNGHTLHVFVLHVKTT